MQSHRIPIVLTEARLGQASWKDVLDAMDRLPYRARLSVSRKLIDVLCALWMNQEDYDPERIQIH